MLALLRRRGLLSQERIDLLLSWRRSGFSVQKIVLSSYGFIREDVYEAEKSGWYQRILLLVVLESGEGLAWAFGQGGSVFDPLRHFGLAAVWVSVSVAGLVR